MINADMYFGGIAQRVFIAPYLRPAAMKACLRLARACEGSEYG